MKYEEKMRKLSEDLDPQELRYLQILQQNKRIKDLQVKMEEVVDPEEDIIASYSSNQYVQQEVEVAKGLTCIFRTLSPFATDESITYARDNANNDTYSRVLGRRRLAHGLLAINGDFLGGVAPISSWASGGEDLKKELTENTNRRYNALEFVGLAEKISEAFGVWEQVIYNRINSIEDLGATIKKSTGISDNEQ